MRTKIFLFLMIPLLFAGCEEKFDPGVADYQNLLVVDGLLHNGTGPYTVKLSYSSPVDNPLFIPAGFFHVKIVDDLGVSTALTESEPGIYTTADSRLQGETGRKYKLYLTSPNGNKYESDWEEIHQEVGIDSVYAQYEYHSDPDLNHTPEGYQFYISSETAPDDSACFYWNMVETWEFFSDYTLDFTYSGYIEPFPNPDTVYHCWATEVVPQIFVLNTSNLSQPKATNFPLHFVSTDTKRLTVKYSVLIQQMVISPAAWKYRDQINSLISDDNFLFASQPFQVKGNIQCVENPEEQVLGYFTAAGISTRRVFLDRPPGVSFYYVKCYADTDLRGLGFIPHTAWPAYLTLLDNGRMAIISEICVDCTQNGGVLNKPDFWP